MLQGYQASVKSFSAAEVFAELKTKALGVAMKAVSTIGWMAAFTLAAEGIRFAVGWIDDYINRVEKSKEALSDSVSAYESVKSELQGITDELTKNGDRMDELLAKDKLTYAEQGELENLREITKELEIQKALKAEEEKKSAREVAADAMDSYKKEFGGKDPLVNVDDYRAELQSSDNLAAFTNKDDLSALIVLYEELNKRQEAVGDTDKELSEQLSENSKDTKEAIFDKINDLQTLKDSLSKLPYDELTSEQKKAFDEIGQSIKTAWGYMDPDQWNQIQFDDIFNTSGIEKTKDDLIALAQAGNLDEGTLVKYPKLFKAISDGDPILQTGTSATKSFVDQIYALAESAEKTGNKLGNAFAPLSKQELISNINGLSEGFESLDKIMASMSGKNTFDYSLLDDKKFKETFEGMGDSYANFIETISDSPKDVKAAQSAFSELVTTWIDSTGALNGLTEENSNLAVSMLSNMGVANAEEVVTNRLAIAQEHLAAQKAYTAQVSSELADATASEIPTIVDEATNSDIAKVALAGLVLQKEYFNVNTLDTSGDIQNIISLIGVIGTANSALKALNTLKAGGDVGGNIGGKEGYDAIVHNAQKEVDDAIAEAANYKGKGAQVNATYSGSGKTDKANSTGSKKPKEETTKDIDWIDRQLKILDDKRSELIKKSEDTYNPSSARENYFAQILEIDKTRLEEYQKAVDQYQKEYEEASGKISKENKAKIESGDMSVDTLSSKESESVQRAMDAYDKLQTVKTKQYDVQKENLDDIAKKYNYVTEQIVSENKELENSSSLLEAQIDYAKESGEVIDSSVYEKLIGNVRGQISNAQKDIVNFRAEMNDLLQTGNLDTSSEEYIDLKEKISDAEVKVYSLKKAQEEYNNQLLKLPIERMSAIISMYQDVGTLIANWGSEVESSGKKLDSEYYQKLISNGATVIDQYKKQAHLIENVMDEYETGSDNWNELYSQLQSVNSEMSSMVQNLQKWNEELLKMPIENMANFSSDLQKVADGLSAVQSDYDTVISTVTDAINEQIDAIKKQQEIEVDAAQSQIDALQEKLDLMDRENELRKLQYDLESKQFALEQARNQKTSRVIRNGEIGYESDESAVRSAQEDLLDSQAALERYNLEQQLSDMQDALDDLNDSYDDQLDKLQKISDKWSEINEKTIQRQNEDMASSIFGYGWKGQILSGNDTALFNTFSGMYQNTADQLKQYQEQIDSTNNIQSLLEDYIASYKSGEITYTEAVNGINGILSQLNQKMSSTDNLQNIFDYLGTVNDTAANADAILAGIQNGLKDTATELLQSMEQYNKNSGMISEYTSSWQQLTNNVEEMLDVLKEIRDNYDTEDDDDDDDDTDNTRYGGGKDGSPGTPGRGEYVNSGPGVFADGIKEGAIGKSSEDERVKMMKYLSTHNLKNGEVPIIAHSGEVVLNPEQQGTYLSNYLASQRIVPDLPTIKGDFSSINNNTNKPFVVNLKYGDLSFPNVRDIDETIEEVYKQTEIALMQAKSKFIK